MKWLEKHPVLTIFCCGIGIFLFHTHILPVTIMEARNFITAREMLSDGHWLLTTMNDLPRYQKPPLPSWFTAVFGYIFGAENAAILRIPTMLMAVISGWLMYLVSFKILADTKHALINALIFLSSFYIIAITNEAPWDIYNHGFMLGAIYFLFQFFQIESKGWRFIFPAALLLGCSFMSKGPIALYAMLIPFLIAYGISYGYLNIKKKVIPIIVFIVLATVLGLWWYLYVRLADPEAFLAITKKETGNWSSYNVRPFYYYWSFFTQTGIWTLPAFISLLYPYLKNKVIHKKAYRLSFFWTVLSVILLSVIPEKKTRYLVPVLFPLAINTGFYIEYVIRAFKDQFLSKERFPVYFHFGLIGIIGIVFPLASYFILKDDLNGLWGYYITASVVLFTTGVLILLGLRKKQLKKVFFLSIVFIMAVKVTAYPLAKAFEKNTAFKQISTLETNNKADNVPIYGFGEIAPETIWHYGKSLKLLDENELDIPSEAPIFNVLVTPGSEALFKKSFEKEYQIKLKETFDINYNISPGEKGHKKRLVTSLYQLKKQL